ncbi:MAG: hypothetical protein M3Y36_02210 [Actinomycetota bacterium]|nr:hypothetical protein [Actinomycetota bacterium]
MLRPHDSDLMCAGCNSLIARVQIRPLGAIQVRDTNGGRVTPLGGVTAMAIAQTRLAKAEAAGAAASGSDDDDVRGVGAARRSIEYLRQEAGELVFDLICPDCGRQYVRSSPDLARSVQQAENGRIILT